MEEPLTGGVRGIGRCGGCRVGRWGGVEGPVGVTVALETGVQHGVQSGDGEGVVDSDDSILRVISAALIHRENKGGGFPGDGISGGG